MARLKVYRTPIGFHDAYVAAPSQKAALEAWGAGSNLFARGVAETVDDPDLTAEPLAHPGTVIKRSRGSAAEQIAALPPDRPKRAAKASRPERAPAAPEATRAPATVPKPKPRPSRADLDAAEAALDAAETAAADERRRFDAREAELQRERRTAEATTARTLDRLAAARDTAERDHRAALAAWRAAR